MEHQLAMFDIVVICLLAGGVIFGAIRGLVWQLAWLTALVASVVVALRWAESVAPMFGSSAPWNQLIAIFVLFVGTSLVVWLVFRALAGFIDRLHLRDFDRQLGAVFGFLKAFVICLILAFFGVTLTKTTRDWVLTSRSGQLLTRTIVSARPLLPPEVHAALKEYLDGFEEQLHAPVDGGAPTPEEVVAP